MFTPSVPINRSTILYTLAVAALSGSLNSRAQHSFDPHHPHRSIIGTVTEQGKPVAGAVVHLKSKETLSVRTYLTTEHGNYKFRNLRPNADYSVWATLQGKRSDIKRLGKFDRKADRKIDLIVR
jgi:Carboxypeptidase regulatory-like domain